VCVPVYPLELGARKRWDQYIRHAHNSSIACAWLRAHAWPVLAIEETRRSTQNWKINLSFICLCRRRAKRISGSINVTPGKKILHQPTSCSRELVGTGPVHLNWPCVMFGLDLVMWVRGTRLGRVCPRSSWCTCYENKQNLHEWACGTLIRVV
jgi:hypothetical protein